MSDPTPDIAALWTVYDFISTHRDRWNQSRWAVSQVNPEVAEASESCGTAFCFAGWHSK